MADETDSHRSGEHSNTTKILLNTSLSTLYYAGAAVLALGGLVVRLWVSGIEDDLRTLRGAVSAEETSRVQNRDRISKLESQYERHAEQHLNYDRAFDAIWKKFDRLEDDRWNRKR